MKAEVLLNEIKRIGIEHIAGVPDSTLKELCNYLDDNESIGMTHSSLHNEGAAVGLATGIYISSGHPACVYLQNSGIGNIVNPVTSIANEEVYGIPMLFIIGWRGEPGTQDEPQHKFMGRMTEAFLKDLDISWSVIDEATTKHDLKDIFSRASNDLRRGKQYAVLVKRGTFSKDKSVVKQNEHTIIREEAIAKILKHLDKEDVVISTTGKISREVYEQSNDIYGQHGQDFLTVGGMGHASMIALGAAINMEEKRVVCIDGDGAVLMHMGALPVIGNNGPENFLHFCLNNDAHESVGGMATGAPGQDYCSIAEVCGYRKTYKVTDLEMLEYVLQKSHEETGPLFIEIKTAIRSRNTLGRPKESAQINKERFMRYHGVK